MELERERRGNVQILRINRPESRNALSAAVIAGIGLGLEEADADPAVRAIVITGTGDRAFCAGMDLRDFAARDDSAAPQLDDRVSASFMRFIREGASKPDRAANATAAPAGSGLLLAFD